jgi:hypothetical protein
MNTMIRSVLIAVVLVMSLIFTLRGTPKVKMTTTNQRTMKTTTNSQKCKEKLDALDQLWDQRRRARQEITKSKSRPKSCPDDRCFYDYFEPEAVCLDDERFGDATNSKRYQAYGDGPKFVCGVDRVSESAKKGNCLIYSVGSNNQIDFEVAIRKFIGNCEVHTFDPTVKPETYVGKNYSIFHDWGFGEDSKNFSINHKTRGPFEWTTMSLKTAMQKLGHTNRTIDIFKMDCEGCEYKVLLKAFEEIARGEYKINQVQVELHKGGNPFAVMKTVIEAADRANMRLFHKERNHWGCAGHRCLEYAFVSNDFLRLANGHYVCDSFSSEHNSNVIDLTTSRHE